jgi:hypothetical protein
MLGEKLEGFADDDHLPRGLAIGVGESTAADDGQAGRSHHITVCEIRLIAGLAPRQGCELQHPAE